MTENDPFLNDMRSWADRAHRATPGADVPPADVWQRVLAEVDLQKKGTATMSTVTALSAPMTPRPALPLDSRGGFRHYANLAATVAIVLGVALAGWFATMQLNQPGSPE